MSWQLEKWRVKFVWIRTDLSLVRWDDFRKEIADLENDGWQCLCDLQPDIGGVVALQVMVKQIAEVVNDQETETA